MANNMECSQKLSFGEAIWNCLKKFADFKGRARRSEFWWWTLLATVINITAFFVQCDSILTYAIWLFLFLIILLPSMAVTARRLHDIGRTALWLLFSYGTFVIGLITLPLGTSGYFWGEEPAYAIPLNGYQENVALVGTLAFMLSIIFFLIIFVFAMYDSKPKSNKYGASPKYKIEQ